MEFSEVVRRRRMVRRYDPARPVPEEALGRLLTAALRAPSAGNSQGTSLLVLAEAVDVAGYWAVTARPGAPDGWLRGMRTAPVLVLVWTSMATYLDRYALPDKGWSDRDPGRWSAPYWYVDAGMAALSALLSAVDDDLGACFFGVPPDRVTAVREHFGVPEEQLSVGVLSVGYPAPAEPATRRVEQGRRPREQRVHQGSWTSPGPGHI